MFISDSDGIVQHQNRAAQLLHPKTTADISVHDQLSALVAEPIELAQSIQSTLNLTNSASTKRLTRAARVDVFASKLTDDLALWRVSTTRLTACVPTKDDALHMTVGRNGAILSISHALREVLEIKPKNLREVTSWPMPSHAGKVELRTNSGPLAHFAIVRSRSVGRQEISFIPLPKGAEVDSLFDIAPVALLQLSMDGTIEAANASAARILDVEDLKNTNLTGILSGVSLPTDNAKLPTSMQFGRLTKPRSEKIIQVTMNTNDAVTGGGIIAVLQDATELKSMEAQFVQSQKMQAIGQLAGGVAHDFNNLLTAISGHCDLLLLRHDESDPDYADLDQIRQNANRAAALVGQLLAFSRKQTLQTQSLDLERTLSDHTHLLNRLVGEKITLALTHGADMQRIQADRRQLEQVIMNLVVNARDAMSGEGVINITTSMRRLETAEKRDGVTIPAGDYCIIAVSDQGTGIPPDKLPHIFEPFFTTKATHEGTGLGLSTVYGIVKQTGGFVFADSTLGVGTTFELIFPAYHGQQSLQAEGPSEQVEDVSTKSDGVVLLVEDEAPVRAFASRALQLKGFSVLEAANAEDALHILQDENLSVDVFVTDVVMPGDDGPTWVSEALKKRPKTKVVFVSGYAENRCDALKQDIPNSVFLPKPFSLNQLTSTVARLH